MKNNQVPLEIGLRLKEARVKKLWKVKDAAEAWGCQAQSWTNFEAGRKAFKADEIIRFSKLLGVEAGWLLTGQVSPAPNATSIPNTVTECVDLPLIGYAAADNDSASRAQIEAQPVDQLHLLKEHYQLIEVIGDSMEPVVLNGQYVVIGSEILPGITIKRSGWLGVLQIDLTNADFPEPIARDAGESGLATFCKRIHKVGDDYLLCTSINSAACQPFTVMRQNVVHLWPVKGVLFGNKGSSPEA